MSRGLRRSLLALALLATPTLVATSFSDTVLAAGPKKDPFADRFAGQILFLSTAPPLTVGSPDWFSGHRINSKDENSDNKWPLHMMIFLKRPLDVQKIDLMVYKVDKNNVVDFVQKIEQFPNQDDARTFYFLVTLRKAAPYEPNLKYQIKAVVPGVGPVAEGSIELNGKEEKISGGPMDFTTGMDLSKPKEEKPTGPFDAEGAREVLKKIVYEDCKTTASPGGLAKVSIKFAAKDGKVLVANFAKDPTPPYSDATQTCILRRFQRAKIKPFTGADQVYDFEVALDVPSPEGDKSSGSSSSSSSSSSSTKDTSELTADLPPEPEKHEKVQKGGGCAGCAMPASTHTSALSLLGFAGMLSMLGRRRRRML